MKQKEGFVLRDICGEYVIMAEGLASIDFGHMLSLNETATWLWKEAAKQGDFTVDSLADALFECYDVTPEVAHAEVEELVRQWQQEGLVE